MDNYFFCDMCAKRLDDSTVYFADGVPYCRQCWLELPEDMAEGRECPDCHDFGGNRYDDGATPCKTCGKP